VLTYSVKEAATALGVSQTSVYRLLYRRLLKPVTGIRRKRISKKQVHQYAQGGGQ
jgi:excisionase family DNA binding protein